MNTAAQVDPVLPTSTQQRITLLDALRGISVLGIALVNVLFFVWPIAKLTSWDWGSVSRGDAIVLTAIGFFAEQQFFPIFTMLFGIGLGLQYSRLSQQGRNFTRVYFRRLLMLLVLGLVHGILLWYGDILTLYALLGVVLFWFRRRSPRTVLASGVVVLMVPVVVQVFTTVHDPCARKQGMQDFRNYLVHEIRQQVAEPVATAPVTWAASAPTSQPAATPDEIAAAQARKAAKGDALIRWIDFVVDDEQVYRHGTIGQMILLRCIYFLVFSPLLALTDMGWRALGLMLLGLYLYRRGWFVGSAHPAGRYRRLVVATLLPGCVLQVAAIVAHVIDPSIAWASCVRFSCMYVGSVGVSLGYMGLMWLMYQDARWRQRLEPLAVVGRMSLTVYLGSSLLFGLVFYGYGLGLMGRVNVLSSQLIALAVLAVLVAFSLLWSRYFQYGPLEWLWRVGTYLRIVPILRPPSRPTADGEASAE